MAAMPQTRAHRTLRGTVVASFATLVALFSHVLGGGTVPAALGVVVPLLLSIAVCVALADARVSLLKLIAAVAISQFLFHTVFVIGVRDVVVSGGSNLAHAGHGGLGNPLVVTSSGHAAHGGSMWIAHLVAGALTVAFLYRSQLVFSRLSDLARCVLRTVLAVFVRIAPIPGHRLLAPVLADEGRPSLSSGFFPDLAPRRGPPLGI